MIGPGGLLLAVPHVYAFSVDEVIPATFGPWQNMWQCDLQHAQLKNNDVWEKSKQWRS